MGITPQQDAVMRSNDIARMNHISNQMTNAYVGAVISPISAPTALVESAGAVGAWAIWAGVKKAVSSFLTGVIAPESPSGSKKGGG